MFKHLFVNLLTVTVLLCGAGYMSVQDVIKNTEYTYYNFQARQKSYDMQLWNSVVMVQGEAGHGTGFFIEKNKVLTAYHVVEGADPSNVLIQDYAGKLYNASIIRFDKEKDVALLRVFGVQGTPLKLANKNAPLGTKIFMMGSAAFEWYSVSAGHLDRIYRYQDYMWNAMQQLARIYIIGGYSGSAVLNMGTGEVVGLAVGGYDGTDLGIVVPAELLKVFLDTPTE